VSKKTNNAAILTSKHVSNKASKQLSKHTSQEETKEVSIEEKNTWFITHNRPESQHLPVYTGRT
jgi:hypothetical protein